MLPCFRVGIALSLAYLAVAQGAETGGSGGDARATYQFQLDQEFQDRGLSPLGLPNIDVTVFARQFQTIRAEATPELAVRKCDRLIEEARISHRDFVDDLLVVKGRLFLIQNRPEDARRVFTEVIEQYPKGSLDGNRSTQASLPGLAESRWRFMRAGFYALKHPNSSAAAARLGIAQSYIAEKNFVAAENELLKLRPSEVSPPSEDPIARPPNAQDELENFVDFLDDNRVRQIISNRCDKMALLWLARIAVAREQLEKADNLYAEYCATFPYCAQDGDSERRQLMAGNLTDIHDALAKSARDLAPAIYQSIADDAVTEILKEPEARRLEATMERLKQK